MSGRHRVVFVLGVLLAIVPSMASAVGIVPIPRLPTQRGGRTGRPSFVVFPAGIGTHFYSATPAKCAAVQAQWPGEWTLETGAASGTLVPQGMALMCDRPLFRLYNNRPVANHRYTTSPATRDAMIRRGWIAEGAQYDGPYDDACAMCVLE